VTIVDRAYASPCAAQGSSGTPGRCKVCRRALVLQTPPQRACSSHCRKELLRLSLAEREARRAAVPFGRCVTCGVEVAPPVFRCPTVRRDEWVRRWRAVSGGRLRFGPEAREWLAAKLGLDPDDEQLHSIALKLAEADRLSVLVDGDRVIGIAKPKREAGA
jgi:hypothetical protein